jgi:hypothetical protein
MASVICALCALTSIACAVLLLRAYRASPAPLLLWSGLGFIGFTVNNVLLFVDLVLVPSIDLSIYRDIFYLTRLMAFVRIILAIIDKNRPRGIRDG